MVDDSSYVPEPQGTTNDEFWDDVADEAAELERRYGTLGTRRLLFMILATLGEIHDDLLREDDDE